MVGLPLLLLSQKEEHKTSSDWPIGLACAQLVLELAAGLRLLDVVDQGVGSELWTPGAPLFNRLPLTTASQIALLTVSRFVG